MLWEYHEERGHGGKYCFGKTPMQTFPESKHLAEGKMVHLRHGAQLTQADRPQACRMSINCQSKSWLGHITSVSQLTPKNHVKNRQAQQGVFERCRGRRH